MSGNDQRERGAKNPPEGCSGGLLFCRAICEGLGLIAAFTASAVIGSPRTRAPPTDDTRGTDGKGGRQTGQGDLFAGSAPVGVGAWSSSRSEATQFEKGQW